MQKYVISKKEKNANILKSSKAHPYSMTQSVQTSEDIIKSVLLEEKINSLFEIPDSMENNKINISRKQHSLQKIHSAESISKERSLSLQNFYQLRSKHTIESISENADEEKKEEEEEKLEFQDKFSTDEEEKLEKNNYLHSGFTKEDVLSASMDLESIDSSLNRGLIYQKDFRENSFKRKIDIETFVGRKLMQRRGNDIKIRESLCYENWERFQEYKEKKDKRCPCYSTCRIF